MEAFLIATAVAKIGGSLYAADAAADAMEVSADIADIQGETAMVTAMFAAQQQKEAGREQAIFIRKESRKATGAAVVGVAGSGVELSGSPMVAIGNQIKNNMMSAANAINNANMRAFSAEAKGRAQAATFEARAIQLREQAEVTRIAGFWNALGAGLDSATKLQQTTG